MAETIWLGDSDCGEGPPDRPEKGPCHPPDGPCVPMKKPGYPARPRSAKKDFCVKCPPKRPCNLNKCPPDSEGTCGKADLRRRDLLKLISESQATSSDMRSNLSRSSIRYAIESTWNLHRLRLNDHARCLRVVQRRSFSDCSGKPPDKPSPCSKPPQAEPECKPPKKRSPKSPQDCKEPETESKCKKKCADVPTPSESTSPPVPLKCKESEREPKVLYRKCPPLPKLPKLPKCPKPVEPKAPEPCPKMSAPKCPPPPSLPKCPECPKVPAKESVKSETEKTTVKCFSQPEKSAEKTSPSPDCPGDDSHGGATKAQGDSEKKKSMWEKISDCNKRKMSTWLSSSKMLMDVHSSRVESQKRSLGTSEVLSSSFPSNDGAPPPMPPWKRSKCKTIEEVCGEEIDPKLKALECEPAHCPKNPHAACYPEKPRCGEVRKPVHRKEDVSGKKMGDCLPSAVPKAAIEKMDYSKVGCEPPKWTKLGPCPVPTKSSDKTDHCHTSETMVKTAPTPLPKPPSAPVVLCPCPPPPKMHPGSCPCYSETEDSELKPLTEPCPSKPKRPCPEIRIYYCPPSKATCDVKKEFDDKKDSIKP